MLHITEGEADLLLPLLWLRVVEIEDDVFDWDLDEGPGMTPEEWREAKEDLDAHRALLDKVTVAAGISETPDWGWRDLHRNCDHSYVCLLEEEARQEDHLRDCQDPGSHPLCELYDCVQ